MENSEDWSGCVSGILACFQRYWTTYCIGVPVILFSQAWFFYKHYCILLKLLSTFLSAFILKTLHSKSKQLFIAKLNTNSLDNVDLFHANFTNTTFQKIRISHLTHMYYKTEIPPLMHIILYLFEVIPLNLLNLKFS